MKSIFFLLFRRYRKELHFFFFGMVCTLLFIAGMSRFTSFQANFFNILSISGTSNHALQKPHTENDFEEVLASFFDLMSKNEVKSAYEMTSMDYQDRISFLDFSNTISSLRSVTSLYAEKQQNHRDHHYFVSFVATSGSGDSLHPYQFLVELMETPRGIKISSFSDEIYVQGRVMEIGADEKGMLWADIVNTGNVDWNSKAAWQNQVDRAAVLLTPELKGKTVVSPGEMGRFSVKHNDTKAPYDLIPEAPIANLAIELTGTKMLHWEPNSSF